MRTANHIQAPTGRNPEPQVQKPDTQNLGFKPCAPLGYRIACPTARSSLKDLRSKECCICASPFWGIGVKGCSAPDLNPKFGTRGPKLPAECGSLDLNLNPTQRPLSSSFLEKPCRILKMNHKKELLRSLWVSPKPQAKES